MLRICWKIPENGMKKTSDPKIVAASVTGALHNHRNLPCQDHFRHVRGKNLVAVVSDGAGSARLGKIGAKVVCSTLCDLLKNANMPDWPEVVRRAVALSREKLVLHRLNSAKSESGITDFAATIVGVVCRGGKGMFFHIGDGAAIAVRSGYEDFVASRPENGNFSCETYFYTQQEWSENLRLTWFDNASTLFLMSDGVACFSFSADWQRIEQGFIRPIDKFLEEAQNKPKAVKALANTLNTPKAQRINSDDKTLVWIKVN